MSLKYEPSSTLIRYSTQQPGETWGIIIIIINVLFITLTCYFLLGMV